MVISRFERRPARWCAATSRLSLRLLSCRSCCNWSRQLETRCAAPGWKPLPWGLSEAVTPNALDVALHRLRRKLGVIDSTMEIINVRGQGYALRQTDLDR